MSFLTFPQRVLDATRAIDFLAPLALRLYLAPIFWSAGCVKLGIDPLLGLGGMQPGTGSEAIGDNLAAWFDTLKNADVSGTAQYFGSYLNLPYPETMAWLAGGTEAIGAVLLLIGFATRWISIPLMVTMAVAVFSAHWQNGWLAIADTQWPLFVTERIEGAGVRLDKAKEILAENGNMEWLSSNGEFVVLNNGIEMATTYFIMLLVLFFIGAGTLSLDAPIRALFMRDRRDDDEDEE